MADPHKTSLTVWSLHNNNINNNNNNKQGWLPLSPAEIDESRRVLSSAICDVNVYPKNMPAALFIRVGLNNRHA